MQNLTLNQLKTNQKALQERIKIVKSNLSSKQQITSPLLLSLVREETKYAHLIASYTPHDYTPNPGGTSGTPVGALAHA